jgi:serine/threonine protein kinase
MHEKSICHRDIKAENVIINDHNVVKIIDFGFSVQVDHNTGLRIFCGTSHYMAPEIC